MRDIQKIKPEEACKAFYDEVKALLEPNERVVVSLPGGRSVQPFYRELPKHSDELTPDEWERVHFVVTDERLVPITHKDSNQKLASDLFLKELGRQRLLLTENVHTFDGDMEDARKEAERYTNVLEELSGGMIHVCILGVGEDGHIGALYPGHELLEHKRREFLILNDSPKPPKERMTLSPAHVRKAATTMLFFIGKAKKDAYDCFKSDDTDYKDCPCKLVFQGPGKAIVVTDL